MVGGALGGDGDGSGLIFSEGKGADADEAAVNESRFALVDRDGGFAIGVTDDDRDVGGAVASRTVGDENFVAFGLGQSGGELDLLLSFEEVFVVKVAFADPWARLARFFPVANELGLGRVNDDAGEVSGIERALRELLSELALEGENLGREFCERLAGLLNLA